MLRRGQSEPGVEIRKAQTADDAGAILDCLAAAFAPYRERYTPAAWLDTVLTPDSISRRLSEMCVFVAVAEGRIAGTIGCQTDGAEGHLRGMAVLPEYQGTGLASALLRCAEEELRKGGARRVTLDTTLPLTRAARFYVRHGYTASGRVRDFFGMQLFEYRKEM